MKKFFLSSLAMTCLYFFHFLGSLFSLSVTSQFVKDNQYSLLNQKEKEELCVFQFKLQTAKILSTTITINSELITTLEQEITMIETRLNTPNFNAQDLQRIQTLLDDLNNKLQQNIANYFEQFNKILGRKIDDAITHRKSHFQNINTTTTDNIAKSKEQLLVIHLKILRIEEHIHKVEKQLLFVKEDFSLWKIIKSFFLRYKKYSYSLSPSNQIIQNKHTKEMKKILKEQRAEREKFLNLRNEWTLYQLSLQELHNQTHHILTQNNNSSTSTTNNNQLDLFYTIANIDEAHKELFSSAPLSFQNPKSFLGTIPSFKDSDFKTKILELLLDKRQHNLDEFFDIVSTISRTFYFNSHNQDILDLLADCIYDCLSELHLNPTQPNLDRVDIAWQLLIHCEIPLFFRESSKIGIIKELDELLILKQSLLDIESDCQIIINSPKNDDIKLSQIKTQAEGYLQHSKKIFRNLIDAQKQLLNELNNDSYKKDKDIVSHIRDKVTAQQTKLDNLKEKYTSKVTTPFSTRKVENQEIHDMHNVCTQSIKALQNINELSAKILFSKKMIDEYQDKELNALRQIEDTQLSLFSIFKNFIKKQLDKLPFVSSRQAIAESLTELEDQNIFTLENQKNQHMKRMKKIIAHNEQQRKELNECILHLEKEKKEQEIFLQNCIYLSKLEISTHTSDKDAFAKKRAIYKKTPDLEQITIPTEEKILFDLIKNPKKSFNFGEPLTLEFYTGILKNHIDEVSKINLKRTLSFDQRTKLFENTRNEFLMSFSFHFKLPETFHLQHTIYTSLIAPLFAHPNKELSLTASHLLYWCDYPLTLTEFEDERVGGLFVNYWSEEQLKSHNGLFLNKQMLKWLHQEHPNDIDFLHWITLKKEWEEETLLFIIEKLPYYTDHLEDTQTDAIEQIQSIIINILAFIDTHIDDLPSSLLRKFAQCLLEINYTNISLYFLNSNQMEIFLNILTHHVIKINKRSLVRQSVSLTQEDVDQMNLLIQAQKKFHKSGFLDIESELKINIFAPIKTNDDFEKEFSNKVALFHTKVSRILSLRNLTLDSLNEKLNELVTSTTTLKNHATLSQDTFNEEVLQCFSIINFIFANTLFTGTTIFHTEILKYYQFCQNNNPLITKNQENIPQFIEYLERIIEKTKIFQKISINDTTPIDIINSFLKYFDTGKDINTPSKYSKFQWLKDKLNKDDSQETSDNPPQETVDGLPQKKKKKHKWFHFKKKKETAPTIIPPIHLSQSTSTTQKLYLDDIPQTTKETLLYKDVYQDKSLMALLEKGLEHKNLKLIQNYTQYNSILRQLSEQNDFFQIIKHLCNCRKEIPQYLDFFESIKSITYGKESFLKDAIKKYMAFLRKYSTYEHNLSCLISNATIQTIKNRTVNPQARKKLYNALFDQIEKDLNHLITELFDYGRNAAHPTKPSDDSSLESIMQAYIGNHPDSHGRVSLINILAKNFWDQSA